MIYILLSCIGGFIGYILEPIAIRSLQGREYVRLQYGKLFSIIALAVLFPLIFQRYPTPEFLIYMLLLILLMFVTLTDMMAMLILNKTLLIFTIPIVMVRIISPLEAGIISSFLGALVVFLLLALLAIISKGQVGGGDVKLYALLGFFFGIEGALLNLFLACIFAMIYSFFFLIIRKRKQIDAISFAPFAALASILIIIL